MHSRHNIFWIQVSTSNTSTFESHLYYIYACSTTLIIIFWPLEVLLNIYTVSKQLVIVFFLSLCSLKASKGHVRLPEGNSRVNKGIVWKTTETGCRCPYWWLCCWCLSGTKQTNQHLTHPWALGTCIKCFISGCLPYVKHLGNVYTWSKW